MKKNTSITINITNPALLSSTQLNQMCEIYLKHHNTTHEKCMNRIKSGFDRMVLYIEKISGKIVGFTGIIEKTHRIRGFIRSIYSVYLGQIYIEKPYRSQYPVQRTSLKIFLMKKLFKPWLLPVIWADSLTYKPYLLIATSAKEFYPHPDLPTPPDYKYLMDYLGKKRYGSDYDPITGCIQKKTKLVDENEAPIHDRLLKNKFIRHYKELNIGYENGNGLLVMTPYCWGTALGIMKKLTREAINKFSLKWKNLPVISNLQLFSARM